MSYIYVCMGNISIDYTLTTYNSPYFININAVNALYVFHIN